MGLSLPRWTRPLLGGSLLLLALSAPAVAHRLQVEVEGQEVAGAGPWLSEGQLLAWVRPLASALGGTVHWDGEERRVDLVLGDRQLSYWVDGRQASLDGVRVEAPAAARLVDGRAYVPVWFTAGLLGWHVDWDGTVMRLRRAAAPAPAAALDPRLLDGSFVFPLPPGAPHEPLVDNYGDTRTWSPDGPTVRQHEGIDILAPRGTPVVAAGSGRIVKMGWGQYGGWRLNISLDKAPGYILYYAHLDRYAPGLAPGATVRAGQVVGYVGDTGYGPEGTRGKFVPHLHVGLYNPSGQPVNPYPYLQRWQG